MDLLGGYSSNDDDVDDGAGVGSSPSVVTNKAKVEAKVQRPDRRYLQAAPQISIMTRRKHGNELIVHESYSGVNGGGGGGDGTTTIVEAPIQGPQADDPTKQRVGKTAGKTEHNVQFELKQFKKQRHQFQHTGQALNPSQLEPKQQSLLLLKDGNNNDSTNDNNKSIPTTVTRTTLGYTAKRLQAFEAKQQLAEQHAKRFKYDDDNKTKGAKEPLVYGSDDEAMYGVWAPPSREERWQQDNALTDLQKGTLAPEQMAEREYIKERDRLLGIQAEEREEQATGWEALMERKMAHLLPPKMETDEPADVSTKFHGAEETDYKGQSWMAPPAGLGAIANSPEPLEIDHHKCYVPKKCVHRFTGHNKGVHRIRLFPKTGHLLLSGGLDGKCKVWSVPNKQVMRTYEGHRAAIRDVQFNHDGTRFVSASFDRYLRLWDTESGKVLQTFGNKKVPYCVEFYPHDDNFFVVGCSDNKIVTYDATTGDITQEYNHHLGPVNSIVFVEDDGGTKMVTSSDDKKILVWEWDIGVPIKYISDPTMHSMPCLTLHPSHQFFVGQSLDNTICVFQAGNRFAQQKKKKFSGHQIAGYACEPSFSADGQFLVSGDGKGKLVIWDWKRHKILQKYRAHDNGPAIGSVWHPLDPSVMFTCGWDGVIKMWQ